MPRSIQFSSRDGLRLHAAHYEAPGSDRPAVVCLAGLTRNARDFHDLAMALSSGPEARHVWALDSRGRGLSENDPDWRNYNVITEAHDVIDLAAIAGITGAIFVGTSRGGILAMVLAAVMPTLIGAVVLNDIGPVIERDGLVRIAGYVGRMTLPASWEEAGTLVADMGRNHFRDVSAEQWQEVARAWFNEKDGRPAPGYDAAIARSVAAMGNVIPVLWPQFEALGRVPVLVLRGEHSDILSAATVEEMGRRHPRCTAITVHGQGHAPLLKDQMTIGAVARFIATAEADWRSPDLPS
jgi:pimeloyl-ACP methyl ester carboxylesterase